MHPKNISKSLLVSLVVTLPFSVKAAQPIDLQQTKLQDIQTEFNLALPNMPQKMGIQAQNAQTLKFLRKRTDKNEVTHTRMQQEYEGYPVFGGYAIIHSKTPIQSIAASQGDTRMSGVVYKDIAKELGKPSKAFVDGGRQVIETFKANYKNQTLSEESVEPMVYIDAHHKAHWAYKVSVFVTYDNKIPERPTAIIEAETGNVLVKWNSVQTLRARARAIGFGGNVATRKYEFGKDFPYLVISRDNKNKICFMENKGVKVVDMENTYYNYNRAMRFGCKDDSVVRSNIYRTGKNGDGYDEANGAFSPANDALYAGYVINRMYKRWYGVPALTKGDKPMQLIMRVHFGKNYENAFWDGKQMTFGDGGMLFHPLVSIGLGAHEISHGFTEQHSDLVYFGEAGGMNEAFSDMAAQAAELYARRSSSWKILGEILKSDSGLKAVRYMRKPSQDGLSIDRADQYYRGLDVHYSSGVYNRLFYLMAHTKGWGTRKAFDVMVKANMDYWTPYSTFETGSCGVLRATKDLGYSLDDVKKSLAEVAIDYSNCGEDVA